MLLSLKEVASQKQDSVAGKSLTSFHCLRIFGRVAVADVEDVPYESVMTHATANKN